MKVVHAELASKGHLLDPDGPRRFDCCFSVCRPVERALHLITSRGLLSSPTQSGLSRTSFVVKEGGESTHPTSIWMKWQCLCLALYFHGCAVACMLHVVMALSKLRPAVGYEVRSSFHT